MGELRVMMGYFLRDKDELFSGVKAEIEAGDTKIIWDKDNEDEVDAAEATFNKLVKKGFIAFSVKKDGSSGDKLKKFDADEEKIIMVAPMVGGKF